MSQTKKCPQCAEEVLIEAKKCKHCGSPISQNIPAGVIIIVLLLAIGIIGAVVFFANNNGVDTSKVVSDVSGVNFVPDVVTNAEYDQLQNGMSYSKASGLLYIIAKK